MSRKPTILWFRNDLRLSDHAALVAAAKAGPVLPVFIMDDEAAGHWQAGGASRWWLHHSLVSLQAQISAAGGKLVLRKGNTSEELRNILESTEASGVFCSRAYEPWARTLEDQIHQDLGKLTAIKRFPGHLLYEPDQVLTQGGAPYRVFTPFWKSLQSLVGDPVPTPPASNVQWDDRKLASDELSSWELLPVSPDWSAGLRADWSPGEAGAHERLRQFVDQAANDYQEQRDRPDRIKTSRLSPHLRFGEVTPKQIWYRLRSATDSGEVDGAAAWSYLRELGWREFSYHLLFHFPELPESNFRPQFDLFPWRTNHQHLQAWQRGQTGYPLVDAGMRELWSAGWMHNRVRMITGSFLVKHLLIDWREGERWFWDTLVDADLASNSASWQWVAGSGADAAPYFRIFNPIIQGEKFDPNGDYVRKWVPEIAALPNKYLNKPWEATADTLRQASVELGNTYPHPLVDHRQARQRALAAYDQIRG